MISRNLDFNASCRSIVFRNHCSHPGEALERLSDVSGGYFLIKFDRHGGTQFWILDGFHAISGLTPVMGLPISGIIVNTQVMFLNAVVTKLEVKF